MIRTYKWDDFEKISNESGVYAWYYNIHISKRDIDILVDQLENIDNLNIAKDKINDFLEKFIFSLYKEEPYQVKLQGKLKPSYIGYVETPKTEVSIAFIEKILANPKSLYSMIDMLGHVSPYFNSPLYVGMAKNLRKRIGQHKNKIVSLKESMRDIDQSTKDDAASFANQVVTRKMNQRNLVVYTIACDINEIEPNLIEHILNRINYPVFGRN